MIFNALISAIIYVIEILTFLLPTGTGFPQEVFDASTYLGNMVGMFNPLIPIDTLGTILGLIIGVELAIFGFKTFKWIISHIPFVGGKG